MESEKGMRRKLDLAEFPEMLILFKFGAPLQ